MKNDARQPYALWIGITRNGDRPPPIAVAAPNTPIARPRARAGNHFETTVDTLGQAPASPAPNRKRTTSNETRPNVAPVSAVNTDHAIVIRMRVLRVP